MPDFQSPINNAINMASFLATQNPSFKQEQQRKKANKEQTAALNNMIDTSKANKQLMENLPADMSETDYNDIKLRANKALDLSYNKFTNALNKSAEFGDPTSMANQALFATIEKEDLIALLSNASADRKIMSKKGLREIRFDEINYEAMESNRVWRKVANKESGYAERSTANNTKYKSHIAKRDEAIGLVTNDLWR